jgi:hypothetical protein
MWKAALSPRFPSPAPGVAGFALVLLMGAPAPVAAGVVPARADLHPPARAGVVATARADVAAPADTAAADSALLALTDDVAREVEDLRGWKFKHPVAKKVYGIEELKKYIVKKIGEEYSDEQIRDTQAFLRTIGALPDTTDLKKTMTEVLLSQIGGFYEPADRSFYLIRRKDVAYGPFVSRVFIAHELTHALDDQYVNLDSLMTARERTEDGEFVVSSLVEGSATALMTAYVIRAQLAGTLDTDDLMGVMNSEQERSQVFFDAPPYFQVLLATYTCGMQFLLRGKLSALVGGGKDVAGDNLLAALADPPRSSEQILHPGKYWDPAARDNPVIVDDDAVTALAEQAGYRVAAVNTAGEVVSALVTSDPDRRFEPMAANVPAYWTNRAATGWGGDRFYLLEGEGGTAGLWITLWDTSEDRDEFTKTYEEKRPDPNRTRVSLGSRGEAFVFGTNALDRETLAARLRGAALGFTQSGKPWSAGG